MRKFAHELMECKPDDTGTFKLYLLSVMIHLCQNETLLGHFFHRYATATFERNVKD